ncbi:hypothetical protein [uncultured Kordia sp.]|uniref:hypothetical protein n=1 Tax=uncultured Kordia sp. TaxID=507699 RepID=UPI0026367448|nr:hypothetical protein [uncultured Kordia sp.]
MSNFNLYKNEKKQLNGLSLNKKSIVNLSNKVGGMNEVPAPTLYAGCANTNGACESGRCITGVQCELDSFLCTNFCSQFNCPPLATTIAPIC